MGWCLKLDKPIVLDDQSISRKRAKLEAPGPWQPKPVNDAFHKSPLPWENTRQNLSNIVSA